MGTPRPPLANARWKLPPREKVHEALSAQLDDRVSIQEENRAEVSSSDRTKAYTVTWSEDRTRFGSNDNASFFRTYAGYPIVAVLLKLGVLPYRPEACAPLRDVPWKAVNKRFKSNYAKAVDHVLTERVADPTERQAIDAYIDEIYEKLATLELLQDRPPGRPPTSRPGTAS